MKVRVPDRVRMPALSSLAEGRERHGYGPAGDRLYDKLRENTSNRALLDLTDDETEVLSEYASTLFDVSGDDASWDADAKNDRAAARRFLRSIGWDV